MMAGAKAGNFLFQPRNHSFTDETPKLIVVRVVPFTGGHIEMIDKGERQRVAILYGSENGNDIHLVPDRSSPSRKRRATSQD